MADFAKNQKDSAEELLRRALLDAEDSAAVALKVHDLPLSKTLTIIFHGRRDIGQVQTFITQGGYGAGATVTAAQLLRVPCDLDLAEAESKPEAEQLYANQAQSLREAIVGADTVLSVWLEPLSKLTASSITVERQAQLDTALPAHRLLPLS